MARIEASVASGVPGISADNAFWTLGRHERLFKGYCAFAVRLFNGLIPRRDREILILRTAIVCRSDYEWGQHRIVAEHLEVLTVEEIGRTADIEWAGWSDHERALLRAVDELNADARLQDTTWETLAKGYDDGQLVEVLMLIGFYHMLAFTVNTVGVELEGDDLESVPSQATEN
ncbi:carboxymuconolactone decarboxylase family protein [Streptomyces plumbiresistens]|uniref:carboxymuconolactone decarboxylase family protein n=1 Tax=Streptomyces plumbiresistens TaxID=511811 RepID=UPI0031E53402